MYASTLLVSEALSQLISLGGAELTNSRRYVDLNDAQSIRWQYASSASITVRVDYSLDDGSSWQQLADEFGTTGTSPRLTAWQTMPDQAKAANVLLRAVALGSGLLTTVSFVEVNYR